MKLLEIILIVVTVITIFWVGCLLDETNLENYHYDEWDK
jgi:hypothetical protein